MKSELNMDSMCNVFMFIFLHFRALFLSLLTSANVWIEAPKYHGCEDATMGEICVAK